MSRAPLRPLLNIPLPAGSQTACNYSRIIPAEELGAFDAWQPEALQSDAPAPQRSLRSATSPSAPSTAESTPADAQQALVDAQKTAYEEGYRDGLKALEEFKKSHAEHMQAQNAARLAQWLNALDEQWAELEPRVAASLCQVGVRLARQVLRQELKTHPEHVLGLAREAVQAISHSARRIELIVNPEDLPMVEEGLHDLLQSRGGRIRADSDMTRGGCRVQADLAAVDATLERRWTEAAGTLGSSLSLNDAAEAGP